VSLFDRPASVTRFRMVHALWRRQRVGMLPGVAPVALVLARTDDTAVGLTDVRGYPNGFMFMLRLRWGPAADPHEDVPWPFPTLGSPDPLDGEPFPGELLRFGMQFADGRRVTNMDHYPFIPEDLVAEQPVLVEAGIGGEGGRLGRGASWDLELAVQPLPPPGPLAFVCAWPGRGVPESRVEIDARLILDAFPELSHLRGRPLPAAGVLELTVEFADGRSVTNLDPPPTIEVRMSRTRIARCSGVGRGPAWKPADHSGIAGCGTWTIGSDLCLRRGRWPSSARGRDEESHRPGSRLTAQRSGRRPTTR
jgi:hypothetical protein